MKRKSCFIWLISAVLGMLIVLGLTACQKAPQSVTADNVRTVAIEGFKDSVDAQSIAVSSDGLEVCRIGTYSGLFVEQGTDTACKNISAIVVHNTSTRMIEKAVLTRGAETYIVTYLPPDGICLVQECTGQTDGLAPIANLIFDDAVQFVEDPSMHTERVQVTAQSEEITIENISGEDIPGSVNVWYKSHENGLFLGGVSYKAAVDDGVLFADSKASVHTAHFDPAKSVLLLVTFSNG